MNEMNELEKNLGSWAPRRPSARIERLLFGKRLRDDEPRLHFHWFMPATAALLLALLLNQQHVSPLPSASGSAPLIAMIVSNQSAAAYLPGSFDTRQNGLRPQTFEWTNGSSSTSSITSLSASRGSNNND